MPRALRSSTLLTAAFLTLAGAACSSDDEGSSTTAARDSAATEEFVSPIPTVPDARNQGLVAALDAIAPGLAGEPEDTISNARNVCDSILGGSSTVLESTKTRFIGDGVESMTDDQSQRIVDLIAAESWCAD